MTLGQKLKELRSLKGLTQKDLADKLHVSFQTVSKWENGENEPDISTLKELATLFNCSVDYLIGSEKEGLTPETQPTKTVAIHHHEAHTCAKCGKDIPENDLVSEDITKRERHGRMTRSVSIGQRYYHTHCLEEVKQERLAAAAKIKAAKRARAKKNSFGWGIAGGVVALAISLVIFLAVPACQAALHPAVAVILSIVIGYAIFAALYCIISGSYIGDVFVWAAGLSIRFPGLIFSWDLEGFAWLIAMKILFAILGFLVGVFALALAIILSGVLGAVSFPFVLIHNIRTDYADSLTD